MSDLVSRARQAHLCGISPIFFYVQQVLLASSTKTTLTHWERPAQWSHIFCTLISLVSTKIDLFFKTPACHVKILSKFNIFEEGRFVSPKGILLSA